ncbi:MAG: right-handed parallel beta-helix repeat-containing protein [Desulfobacterales bacterium]|nr:right-handed parallel beta-helix repeat-containing protein [Desulfobacterales bacterium]
MKKNFIKSIIIILLANCLFVGFLFAGDLEPTVGPSPTMRSLDSIETRTSISELPFLIQTSGSYFLTGDLTSNGNGIEVNANNVTIDFRGFSISGVGIGIYKGIVISSRNNVVVKNGTIKNFGDRGIYEWGANSYNHRITNMSICSNLNSGIVLGGTSNYISNCIISDNGQTGISVVYNCIVRDNVVRGNQAVGVNSGSGCIISDNIINSNGGNGLVAISGCKIMGNLIRDNNLENDASFAGIKITDACTIFGNLVTKNKQVNIYVSGSGNSIESNLVSDSTNGIFFVSGGNFYANNKASSISGTSWAGNVPTGDADGGGNIAF